jgi:ADP-ribosyl-[dinitrogen reductase] hydrolase
MIGAIIGDIVGSRFEFNNHRSTEFDLFHKDCSYTDDSICTVAVADWLIKNKDPLATIMRQWCRKYPNPKGSYGMSFRSWVLVDKYGPYYSYGNGSAMRVSPVAWASNTIESTKLNATNSASITHSHPEGIKGAQAISQAIFMLKKGIKKEIVCSPKQIQSFGYSLKHDCQTLQKINIFDETCMTSVPYAFQCLKESTDFESAIRLAVSIGGDSDTIAAITGSLAEACYEIPEWIEDQAMTYLTDEMKNVINEFKMKFNYGRLYNVQVL